MLLVFGLLLINYFFVDFFNKVLHKCYPHLVIGDIEIDEIIDNYWLSIDDKDRTWTLEEDKYSTEKLGIQIFTKR